MEDTSTEIDEVTKERLHFYDSSLKESDNAHPLIEQYSKLASLVEQRQDSLEKEYASASKRLQSNKNKEIESALFTRLEALDAAYSRRVIELKEALVAQSLEFLAHFIEEITDSPEIKVNYPIAKRVREAIDKFPHPGCYKILCNPQDIDSIRTTLGSSIHHAITESELQSPRSATIIIGQVRVELGLNTELNALQDSLLDYKL